VASTVAQPPRKEPRLIEGRLMICPRCKRKHDILAYIPMEQIEEFAAETNPIYKCPSCRWIFSPAPHALEVFR
jgi:rubredoxin